MLKKALVRWLDILLDRPWLAMGLFAMLIAVCSVGLARLEFDQSTDSFFDQDAQYAKDQKTLERSFGGSDGEVLVTVTAPDIFTSENLALVGRLSEQFEPLDNVDDVISLTTVNDTVGEKDNFIVEKLVKEIPTDPAALAKLRAQALSNPLFVKNVISPDGQTAGLILRVRKATGYAEKPPRDMVEKVRAILARETPKGVEWHVSGSATVDVDYQGFMERDMSVFMPLAMALMALVLYATLRRVRLMAMPLIVVGVCLAITMSLVHWFGFKLNSISVSIPPIIMGVVIGDSIHYVMHAVRQGGDPVAILRATTRRLLFPCFMTTATTAIGFLSLLTSRSPAMRQMGMVASCGVMIAYGVTFMLLPAVMRRFCRLGSPDMVSAAPTSAGKGSSEADRTDRLLNRLSDFYLRHYRLVVIAAALVGLVGLAGVWAIRVETSMIEQLNHKSAIYKDTLFIEKHLTGVEVLYVSLKHPESDGFKDPEALRAQDRMQTRIAAVPGVDKALSVTDFIKDMHRSFNEEKDEFYGIPDSRPMVAQYALLYGADDIQDYIDPDWSWSVIRVRINEHVTSRLNEVMQAIWQIVREESPSNVTVDLLGPVRTEVEGVDTVVIGQIWSLVMSFGVVFAIMFMAFRSVSAGWVSVLPNVMPLLVNFGIMGLWGIRLDTATALISAISIGIIVDNTIHFIDGYRQYLAETGSHEAAMRKTMLAKGRAVVFTTLVLVCSFGVLMFSAFVPIFQFGLLCSILMISAMLGDMMVMPCLALWVRPHFPPSRSAEWGVGATKETQEVKS